MVIQELLKKVKATNRMTGNYSDETYIELIDQVKQDLIGMGVKEEIVNSRIAIGAIAQGVYEKDTLHQYTIDFEKRVMELRKRRGV